METVKIHEARHRLDAAKSDLSGSVFIDVNLSGASFDDVNMSGWRVHNVNLSGLHLANANLAGAAITDSRLDGMTIDGIPVTEMLAAFNTAQKAKRA